jgi:hypothetical protein
VPLVEGGSAIVDGDDEFELLVALMLRQMRFLVRSRPATDAIPNVTVLSSMTAAAAGEQVDVRGSRRKHGAASQDRLSGI